MPRRWRWHRGMPSAELLLQLLGLRERWRLHPAGVHAGRGHSVSVRAGQSAACQAPATAGQKTRSVSHTPRWCQRRGRPIARAHRLRCLAPAHGHDQVWSRGAVRARETRRTRGPQQHARVCMLLCRYLRPAACTRDGSSGDSAARHKTGQAGGTVRFRIAREVDINFCYSGKTASTEAAQRVRPLARVGLGAAMRDRPGTSGGLPAHRSGGNVTRSASSTGLRCCMPACLLQAHHQPLLHTSTCCHPATLPRWPHTPTHAHAAAQGHTQGINTAVMHREHAQVSGQRALKRSCWCVAPRMPSNSENKPCKRGAQWPGEAHVSRCVRASTTQTA